MIRLFRRSLALALTALAFNFISPSPADAQVFTWGDNEKGQLGDNSTINRHAPSSDSVFDNAVFISGGWMHSLFVRNNSTVWGSGWNFVGQLGDSTYVQRNSPVQTIGLLRVCAVAAGGSHSMALRNDCTVWVWGWGAFGQLGNGSTNQYNAVPKLSYMTNATAIAAGYDHCLALRGDGTVWAWGWNQDGELGDGTTVNRTTPTQVLNLTDITAVSSEGLHSLALRRDGTVWAWGSNSYGQLGNSSSGGMNAVPAQVSGLTDVVAISCGYRHSIALKRDGTVWGWGLNDRGEIGSMTPSAAVTMPVKATGLGSVIAVSCGQNHSLFLLADHSVWATGDNVYGQLGFEPLGYRILPESILGLSGVTKIAGGGYHSMALKGIVRNYAISGTLKFEGISPAAQAQTITFEFRSATGQPFTRTASVSSTGLYSIPDIPAGEYVVHIAGRRYLSVNMLAYVLTGDVSGLDMSLAVGDVDGNNAVDLLDLIDLLNVYGASSGDGTYDSLPYADLNVDGTVDLTDLILLLNNYGASGNARSGGKPGKH